jgi:hypothetical protein
VLEIGPGPKSVLGHLPSFLRESITKYVAFEPNSVFATALEEWICSNSKTESAPMPCLQSPPDIHRVPFEVDSDLRSDPNTATSDSDHKFDVVLFCHSMYGMKHKHKIIERALEILVERGTVVIFHRQGNLHFDGLTCHRTSSFPTGITSVENDDNVLDRFAAFVAGFHLQDADVDKAVRVKWHNVCRTLARREEDHPDHLLFSSPDVMVAFTKHAFSLPELTAQVPLVKDVRTVKNQEARLHHPALIVRPTEVCHIQQCARWAIKHDVRLTVISGGHSGHCLWPNVVSVDMSAFDQVHILTIGGNEGRSDFRPNSGSLVVVEAGCKTGDIIRKTMVAGLTVPLGARPSVGAGLWLQGGIGHLARLHGLACDAIVGAVVVSLKSGKVLCVGHVPSQHQPAGAVIPENEADLLWAMKGAGTNFGIVVSVTFNTYAAPAYLVRNWDFPLADSLEARRKLGEFDEFVAKTMPRNCSADAYLYCDSNQLHLGVTMFESSTSRTALEMSTHTSPLVAKIWGQKTVSVSWMALVCSTPRCIFQGCMVATAAARLPRSSDACS